MIQVSNMTKASEVRLSKGSDPRSGDSAHLVRSIPQLLILSLACLAMWVGAVHQATAGVLFQESFQAQAISYIPNSDGSSDQEFVGTGSASPGGAAAVDIHAHLGLAYFDPAANAFLTPLSGAKVVYTTLGDRLYSNFTGTDGPTGFGVTQRIAGGTGQFRGATGKLQTSGQGDGQGNIAFTSSGTMSLVPPAVAPGPIVVKINDLAVGPPEVEVDNAPNGYDINTGPIVNNPAVEDGALITLFGVDTYGGILDWGGRFVDPSQPANAAFNALDIVWVQHDYSGPFGAGDLQVGFNSRFPGGWYRNPLYTGEDNLGPVSSKWKTVYSTSTLVIRFKGPAGK